MHGSEGMGFGMGWWWIIGIFIVVAFVVIIFVFLSRQNNQSNKLPNQKSNIDILEERYARGEIDKQEFDQRKNDLI